MGRLYGQGNGPKHRQKTTRQNLETRKSLHNCGWKWDEILSQSRHEGTTTHHAPAPSGGHGEHNRD